MRVHRPRPATAHVPYPAEAQGASPAHASEPPITTVEEPESPAQLAPAILRRPYALAPVEVACMELVQESAQQPGTTAQDDEGEPSTAEQQIREAEAELKQCLAVMGESCSSLTPTISATQRPVVKPVPRAPEATEIPTWAEIRLRHDTGSKRKAYNPRRHLQLDDYEPQHLRRRPSRSSSPAGRYGPQIGDETLPRPHSPPRCPR